MSSKPSKNQSEFVKSASILGLLLILASGLLWVMRSQGQKDSLLEIRDEPLPLETGKRRSRLEHSELKKDDKSLASSNKNAASSASAQKEKVDLQKVMQMIDSGQWREAELMLQEILQKDPRDEGALVEMAMLQLIDKHDSRAAQPFLERTLEVNADNEAALQEILGVYEETRNWDQGLAFLRSLPAEARKTGYVDYGIGSALMSMGRPAEAVASLQKAVYDYGYREYTAREGLAEALVDAGRIDEGIREYQNISEGSYKPNQIRISRIRIASALMEKQQFTEARSILKPLQEADPRDEWVASLLRELESKDGRQRM